MEKVSECNPMVPEANTKPSIPYIPWYNLGDFLSETPPKIPFSPFHATQRNPSSIPLVHPIRQTSPTSGTTCDNSSGSTPSKFRKPNLSKKLSSEDTADVLGAKKPKSPGKKKGQTMPTEKREKNPNTGIQISSFDFSCLPSPVCSCTGIARVCYSWGAGGWQSACCSTSVSQYPLPLKRPGCRMPGRKMSQGAYMKLLTRLTAAGHDLSHPIDLREHWARHGTNRYVTIK